jgi:predicted DNA-binding protein
MRKVTPGDRLWRLHRRLDNRRSLSLWLDKETMARLDELASQLGMTTPGVVAQIVRYTLSGRQGAPHKLAVELKDRFKNEQAEEEAAEAELS